MNELRKRFKKEKGIDWENSQGEPDIEYVEWLEAQLASDKCIISKDFFGEETILGGFGTLEKTRGAVKSVFSNSDKCTIYKCIKTSLETS